MRGSSNGNTNGTMNGGGTLAKKDLNTTTLERTIYQYHFTAWPDHGVPLHALPLISFIRNSAAAANTASDLESNLGSNGGAKAGKCKIIVTLLMSALD